MVLSALPKKWHEEKKTRPTLSHSLCTVYLTKYLSNDEQSGVGYIEFNVHCSWVCFKNTYNMQQGFSVTRDGLTISSQSVSQIFLFLSSALYCLLIPVLSHIFVSKCFGAALFFSTEYFSWIRIVKLLHIYEIQTDGGSRNNRWTMFISGSPVLLLPSFFADAQNFI